MNNLNSINGIIESKLLTLHTAYIGKVLKYSNGKADIQPLQMIKQYGRPAEQHSPIPNVPVTQQARFKMSTKTANTGVTNITYIEPVPLAAGDIVVCVCGERDITEAKNGKLSVPTIGHHSMSDSIVVGIL